MKQTSSRSEGLEPESRLVQVRVLTTSKATSVPLTAQGANRGGGQAANLNCG